MKIRPALLAFTLATALSSGITYAATKADYEQALSAAQAAQAAAAAVRGEWRDTGKLIKQATEAAEAGDYAKAIELAQIAEAQGKNGERQAKESANVGNPAYLYQ